MRGSHHRTAFSGSVEDGVGPLSGSYKTARKVKAGRVMWTIIFPACIAGVLLTAQLLGWPTGDLP